MIVIVDLLVDDSEWVGCLRDVIHMIVQYALLDIIREIDITCKRWT
jgi:hypothetical protein